MKRLPKTSTLTASDLRAQAEKLIADGMMPDLNTVLDVVGQIRKEYQPKILEARRQARIDTVWACSLATFRSRQALRSSGGRSRDALLGRFGFAGPTLRRRIDCILDIQTNAADVFPAIFRRRVWIREAAVILFCTLGRSSHHRNADWIFQIGSSRTESQLQRP